MTKPTTAAEILALPQRDKDRIERFSVRPAYLTPDHESAGYALDDGFLAARDADGQWWRAIQVANGEWRRLPFDPPVKG
jgi:hypothetical protein